ncbi:hypothetical protein LV84_01734 [Algoriphagus ratkowskyi]|uniref:Secreted protein n=1 Tax=Algoriphagus ratkowskyi TaxID=57028 RepID=A0A2W7REP9_9BACT|nr:DUF6520 family protein [Algoriphagus ratkowskyi]PZX57606.1 hypothetical protein LV84_01734 [Algoriphagus ratkowskyi]TXD78880.1 hypothetical protein ESW18_05005 [Algoriphagus ratkowskyi]
MKTLFKRLPAFAFVLAAFAAFAFTSPQVSEWGQIDETTFVNVTGLTPGPSTYQCDSDPQACTRSAANDSAPVIKQGLFINNMD